MEDEAARAGVFLPPSWRQQEDVHRYSARFYSLLDEIKELHRQKGKDYGTNVNPLANIQQSEDFGVPGWVGAIIRANDKVTRLKSFATRGDLANESVDDSLRDLAAYAIIALVLWEEGTENGTLDSWNG
jgi:hypothetical protein